MNNCHLIHAPGVGRKIDPLNALEAGTQSLPSRHLRLSQFLQPPMSTPPNRRVRMASKGIRGHLRFVGRTFGSMPGQAKMVISAIIMLWIVLFTLQVLPNIYFLPRNQTTIAIRDLSHDAQTETVELKAFKTSDEATTITQSDFISSVELAEQDELEKGAPPPPSTPKIEDQTMSSEEKAQIVERMKRHVTFINVTEVKRLIGFRSPKPLKKSAHPQGQGSAFNVLRLRKPFTMPPPRVHLRLGANDDMVLNIPSRSELNRTRRQVEDDFQSNKNENESQQQLKQNEIGPRPVENDGTANGASSENAVPASKQGQSLPPDLTSPEADDAEPAEDSEADDDAEDDTASEDATATEVTSAPEVEPDDLGEVTGRDVSYEESLIIAEDQRMMERNDYNDLGMDARLAKRYPRWKKIFVAGLPL
ncbi:unnamed protein product [Orchesella dallaii]|uniref:Uncharacterized protein n=1 Tax=Orchesella dallaii TaxID=48710 RepID=A0ABP1Q150_9HEXA